MYIVKWSYTDQLTVMCGWLENEDQKPPGRHNNLSEIVIS